MNGVPLSDLSSMQLRIDLKRLLEEKNSFLCAETEGDAVEAGLRPGLVACGGGQGGRPNSYFAAQSWCCVA